MLTLPTSASLGSGKKVNSNEEDGVSGSAMGELAALKTEIDQKPNLAALNASSASAAATTATVTATRSTTSSGGPQFSSGEGGSVLNSIALS